MCLNSINHSFWLYNRIDPMRIPFATTLCCLLLICPLAFSSWACTSFCLDTPDGPVFGTNLDPLISEDGLVIINPRGLAKKGIRKSSAGERARWISKYGSVTFSLSGREYAWSGINEAGLVLSSMQLKTGEHPEPDERPPVLHGRWAQYVLDTCGSVHEALQVESIVRIEGDDVPTDHYLVADAAGNCAAIEYVDGDYVYYTGESLPVKAMSNMRYKRALAALERGGSRWWWSNPGRSAERFAAAHARNKSYDSDRDSSAVRYAFGTLTRVVATTHTKWNIVYDIAKRKVYFRSAASPAVKHLSLNAFNVACGAPLLMIDINAVLEGNIEKIFKPYDREVNMHIFHTHCARNGIDVSPEDADKLIDFFESFECSR
jgi:penicillin V acylase-like amidase (Ntn superfamily)